MCARVDAKRATKGIHEMLDGSDDESEQKEVS